MKRKAIAGIKKIKAISGIKSVNSSSEFQFQVKE